LNRSDEKQSLLDLAESMAGVGRWRLDLATRRSTWSDAVYAIYGVDRETFEPGLAGVLERCVPEDREIFTGALATAIAERSGLDFEFRARRPDGQIRHVMSKGVCELDEAGEPVAVAGVIQDITRRVEAMEELRANTERYRLLSEDLARQIRLAEEQTRRVELAEQLGGLGHWRFDVATKELNWSPKMYEIYGLDPGEPLDLDTLLAMTHPDDQTVGRDRFTRALMHGEAGKSHLSRLIRRDGVLRYVRGSIATELDMAGAVTAVIGSLLDVTEHRLITLEAQAATEAKSQFLANMSHELRTPLTSIIGFTSLAAEQPDLSPVTRGYLERVGDASEALLCTVNDVLDFSKLEAGQVSFHPRPVSVAVLARRTLELFAPQAGAKDLTLSLEGDIEDLIIAIDPDRVRQILLNLVGNAVKFTASGGVTVRIDYAADSRLTVEVIDTGEGIAADKQGMLFQRFSQVDGSLTRTHGGTGLGLAICKGLAEAMGGEIGVDSAPGRGSRFWFAIPAERAALPEARQQGSDALSPVEGLRVLVADDHPANRKLASLFLAGIGAEVAEACDGEEAARMAAEWPYDVILMDVRMPKVDGPGALRAIRQGGGPNDAIPILAFTADCGVASAKTLISQGCAGVVAKPLEPRALLTAITEVTRSAPVSRVG
jgi:PAS domain S-box-containing protein